jgi:hypothetical protein
VRDKKQGTYAVNASPQPGYGHESSDWSGAKDSSIESLTQLANGWPPSNSGQTMTRSFVSGYEKLCPTWEARQPAYGPTNTHTAYWQEAP